MQVQDGFAAQTWGVDVDGDRGGRKGMLALGLGSGSGLGLRVEVRVRVRVTHVSMVLKERPGEVSVPMVSPGAGACLRLARDLDL